jgi:hypothetical protein
MIEFCIYLSLLIVFFFIYKRILYPRIQIYDSKLWSVIESVWLIISFIGVSIGIYELDRIKSQIDYKNKETSILGDFQDIKSTIYGLTMVMHIDDSTRPNRRESINWFHTMQSLLEDGYKNNKWRKFVFYTRGFVFKDFGNLADAQENALIFKWPENINQKSEDLEFKDEIDTVTTQLIRLENHIDYFEKQKPDEKPLFLTRHVFLGLFVIALSLKLLKTYADYIKSTSK